MNIRSHMIDIDAIRENIAVLNDDVRYLERKLDRLDRDSLDAESAERILNAKYRLLQEQQDMLDRAEIEKVERSQSKEGA